MEEGERSQAEGSLRTFLIGDVRGYTRFTAEHGDVAAAALATAFAALARDAVEARSGRVIELRGDEVLAVFDSSAQAVRAALELQTTCAEEMSADPSLPLLVGIGIAAGEAVPVEDGYRGASLNLAARLCSTAAAGEVNVSEWVAELAGSVERVVLSDRGTVELKGFPDPVAYLSATAPEGPLPFVPAGLPSAGGLPIQLDASMPLVGREHEMRWARGGWRQARRGAGRILFVSGPTGIGKTRLAAQIALEAGALGATVCFAGAGGTALADMLGAIQAARSATEPTLVVLDDLDAAGDRVAMALDEGVESIEGRPAMVVALVRESGATAALASLMERVDPRGDGHRSLGPLDLDDVREVCRTYAGDDVAEAPLESIARSSAGVPGRIHELANEWAHDEATRRLTAAAEWFAAGRERQAAGLGFANNVIGLKLERLYRVPAAGDEGATCPYKGLASFGPQDAGSFFGRETLVGELAARIVGVGMLGVVGASGSGKSSLLAAGLRSSLAAGLLPGSASWRQVALRPGAHPMAELRRSLEGLVPARDVVDPLGWAADTLQEGERLVVAVDQFEEVFTTCEDPAEAEAFVGALVAAASRPDRTAVLIALRGDFYGRTAEYPALAEALSANHVLVGPMTAQELRRAIELPARRSGLQVESPLVDRLVADVADAPGGLPLLSTSLVELWGERRSGWLRLDDYERTGGVKGAVARLAEQTYADLTEDEGAAAHAMFLRLVGPGQGEAATRRRVPIEEFDPQVDLVTADVMARFLRDRLLTADDRTVEVAHEALLREWPRLRSWLADDAQGRELRTHLTTAAAAWHDSGEEDSELYRGARLSTTLDWAAGHDAEMNELERRFLTDGRRASEREGERQRRANRRLRGLLVGVAIFLVLALIAGSIAVVQRTKARTAATEALGQSVGALGPAQQQFSRALLLAREGFNLAPSEKTEGTLLSTLQRAPAVIRTFTTPDSERPLQVMPIDAEKILALGMNSNAVRFYDTGTSRPLGTYPASSNGVWCCVPGPSGTAIVIVNNDPTVVDPMTGRTLRTFKNDPAMRRAEGLFTTFWAASRDERTLFEGWSAGSYDPNDSSPMRLASWVSRWNVASGRFLGRTRLGLGTVIGMDLTDHGSDLSLVTALGEVQLDARSMALVRKIPFRASDYIGGASATNADGTIAVYGSTGGRIHFVDLRTGSVLNGFGGPAVEVDALRFSPTEPSVAVSSYDDGSVVIWDAATATAQRVLDVHGGRVNDLAFSQDGRDLFTASLDGTAIESTVTGRGGFGSSYRIFDSPIGGYPPLAAGARVSAFYRDARSVTLVDNGTGKQTRIVPVSPGFGVGGMALSTDDAQLAVMSSDDATHSRGRIELWSVGSSPTFAHTIVIGGFQPGVDQVAFADDGRIITAVTGNEGPTGAILGGSFHAWRTSDGRPAFPPVVFRKQIGQFVAVNDAGTVAAVGLMSAHAFSVALFDAETGDRLGYLPSAPGGGLNALGFVPDGTLLTGGYDGSVQRWTVPALRRVGAPVFTGSGPVTAVQGVPRSPWYLSANFDGSVKLWSLATGQQIGSSFTPIVSGAPGASASGDGSTLAVETAEGVASIFPADPLSWAQRACASAGRNLTKTEWQQYIGTGPWVKVCPQYPLTGA